VPRKCSPSDKYWKYGGKEHMARYYARIASTPEGRKRLAEYKAFRRACIRDGTWGSTRGVDHDEYL
jgi:hypothetical protein